MKGLTPIPSKLVTLEEGTFHCTYCKATTEYCFKERIERRLLVFIIPIEGDTLETFVECQNCKKHYPADYLRRTPTGDLKILEAIKDRLLNGQSTQTIHDDLCRSGVADGTIQKYIRVALGIGKRSCVQCESVYHGSVIKCIKCGILLSSKNVQDAPSNGG